MTTPSSTPDPRTRTGGVYMCADDIHLDIQRRTRADLLAQIEKAVRDKHQAIRERWGAAHDESVGMSLNEVLAAIRSAAPVEPES